MSGEIEKCDMTGDINMKGMERQNLHSTAFTIVYHAEKLQDAELVALAREYLIRIMNGNGK